MQDVTAVYCSLIRSVLEYACGLFANLLQCLSNALESIQKWVVGIIAPSASYEQALSILGLTSLRNRRDATCKRFVSKIGPPNLPFPMLSSRVEIRDTNYQYNIKRNTTRVVKPCNNERFSQFVTCRYANILPH